MVSLPLKSRKATGPARKSPESTIRYRNINEYLKTNLKSIECPQHGAGGILRPDGNGRTGHRVKCLRAENGDIHKFCIYKLAAYIQHRPSEIPLEEWAQCLREYPKGSNFRDNIEDDMEHFVDATEQSIEQQTNGSQPIILRGGEDTTHSVSQTLEHLTITTQRSVTEMSEISSFPLDTTPNAIEDDSGAATGDAHTNRILQVILNAIKDLGNRFETFEKRTEKQVECLTRKVEAMETKAALEMKQAIQKLNEQTKQESQKREEAQKEILSACKQIVPERNTTKPTLSYVGAAAPQGGWKTVQHGKPTSPAQQKNPATIQTQNQFAVLGERPELVEMEGFPLKVLRPEIRRVSINDVFMGTDKPTTKPKTRAIYVRSRRQPYKVLKGKLEKEHGIPRYAILELCFLGDNLLSLITHEDYADCIEEIIKKNDGVPLPDFDPLLPEYRELFGDRAEVNMSRALGTIAFRASETQKCNYTGKREAIMEEYGKYAQTIIESGIKLTFRPEEIDAMKAYVDRVDKPSKKGPKVLPAERQLANSLRTFLPQHDVSAEKQAVPAPPGMVVKRHEPTASGGSEMAIEISSNETDVEI
jgi:hypothetical protein